MTETLTREQLEGLEKLRANDEFADYPLELFRAAPALIAMARKALELEDQSYKFMRALEEDREEKSRLEDEFKEVSAQSERFRQGIVAAQEKAEARITELSDELERVCKSLYRLCDADRRGLAKTLADTALKLAAAEEREKRLKSALTNAQQAVSDMSNTLVSAIHEMLWSLTLEEESTRQSARALAETSPLAKCPKCGAATQERYCAACDPKCDCPAYCPKHMNVTETSPEKSPDITKADGRILPCPFCGSTKVLNWLSHDAAPNTWCVFCESCNAEGPHGEDEELAVSRWNGALAQFLHFSETSLAQPSSTERTVTVDPSAAMEANVGTHFYPGCEDLARPRPRSAAEVAKQYGLRSQSKHSQEESVAQETGL